MKLDHVTNEEITIKPMEVDYSYNNKNAPRVVQKHPLWLSKRFLIIILIFFGYSFTIGIKVCINLVVLQMKAKRNVTLGNQTIEMQEFNFDTKITGLIQSSFTVGALTGLFGGYLSTKFGGCFTYGLATAAESLFAILNPFCMKWAGLYGFIACRTITGAFDGIAFASTAEIYSRWIPAAERSRCMSIIFSGVYIATAFAYPLFGYVAQHSGWRMLFYITGGSTMIWSVIWLIVARNEPSSDKLISEKEQLYIANTAETTPRNQIAHPYMKMLHSPAVWALGAGTLTYVWGFSVIIEVLPMYVSDMTGKQLQEIGLLASFPNFACIFMTPVVGAILDFLQNNTNLKPSQIHKILMTFGFLASAILLIIVAFAANFTVSMICFILIKLFLSFNFLVLQLICQFMAPKHSNVLLGFSLLWWVVGLSTVPLLTGFVVTDHTVQQWSICFLLSAGVMMFGCISYLVFGSSELQPWAK